jgi:hypothetical protein
MEDSLENWISACGLDFSSKRSLQVNPDLNLGTVVLCTAVIIHEDWHTLAKLCVERSGQSCSKELALSPFSYFLHMKNIKKRQMYAQLLCSRWLLPIAEHAMVIVLSSNQ